jgi:hypothetical protein
MGAAADLSDEVFAGGANFSRYAYYDPLFYYGEPLITNTIWFTPESTGTYYLELSDPGVSLGSTYSASAVTEPNDHTDNPTTSGTVDIGGAPITGTIGVPGDTDWLAVSLTANQAYEFTIIGLTDDASIEVGAATDLAFGDGKFVYDTAIESDQFATPATNNMWFTPDSTGTYYVELKDDNVSSGTTYSVSAVTEPNDHTGNTTTSGTVTVGGAATTGTLGALGEIDWLAVTLTANQAYEFTINGLTDVAEIEVGAADDLGYGGIGLPVPANYANYATPATNTVWFTPESTGTYYVFLTDAGATLGTTYSVSAVTEPNDHSDNTTTSGKVTVGGAATIGTLGVTGEIDWLAVSLTANQAYEFTISGLTDVAQIEVGSASDLKYDNGGLGTESVNESAYATKASETVWFTPDSTGTYYVQLSDSGASLGSTYSVSAVTVPNDYTDNTTTSGKVTVGGAATIGTLGVTGEIDWLAVSLTANQAYEFTINGLTDGADIEVGSATDLGTIGLGYGAGAPGYGYVQVAEDGTNPATDTVWFTPESTGTYYIALSDRNVSLGSTYSVSAVAVPNDHTDNTTTSGIVVVSAQQSAYVTSPEEITSGNDISNPTIAGGNLILDSGADVIGNVSFSGTNGVLTIESNEDNSTTIPANTIIGFATGDTIKLADVAFSGTGGAYGTSGEDTYTVAIAGILTIDADGTDYNLLIAGATIGQDNFVLSGDLAITEAACYAAGTHIATAVGEMKVEDLEIGDLVETLDCSLQKIKWIGRRSYDGRFIAGNKDILPIRIARGAIGEEIPSRDLFVSPGHAICIDGALIRAFRLVNGVSITQTASVDSITYYHIETENHEIIFAENCPAETFIDENFRAQFQNAAQFRALYPGQSAASIACLSRLEDGFALHAIQQRLNARAGLSPQPATQGPLRGYVDEPGPTICSGWAQDSENPETPVCLDIMLNGARVARLLANLYRADLRQAGLGSGCHAFRAVLPAGLSGPVEVRRAADGAELAWTDAALALAA